MDGSFFYVRVLPGSNGSNVYALLRSSQSNVPGRSATSRALNDRWEAFSYKGLPIFLPFLN